jgi:hypothetical protein
MAWPAVNDPVSDGEADFTTLIAGAGGAVTVAEDGGEFAGVVVAGGVPCAVAVLWIVPASTSACDTE